jgi:hypothetical protein
MLKPQFAALDIELARLYGQGLLTEQLDCLTDPTRSDEAADMLDDMCARLGVQWTTVAAATAAL